MRLHHRWGGILFSVLLAVSICASGCIRRENKPTMPVNINYDVSRPEWLKQTGVKSLPEVLRTSRITAIKELGDELWVGVYNYGAARLDSNGDWKTFPLKYSMELVIQDFEKIGSKVYATSSGNSLIRFDPGKPGQENFIPQFGKLSKRMLGIVRFGDILWLTSEGGLMSFDVKKGKFKFHEKGVFFAASRWKNELWTIRSYDKGYLRQYDAKTGKLIRGTVVPPSFCRCLRVLPDHVELPITSGYSMFSKKEGRFLIKLSDTNVPIVNSEHIEEFAGGRVMGSNEGIIFHDPANDEWLYMGRRSGLPPGRINEIRASKGILYIGMDKGLFVIEPALWDKMLFLARQEVDRRKAAFSGALSDRIGTDNENPSDWVHLTISDGLLSNNVYSIATVGDEAWLGTGLLGLTQVSLTNYTARYFLMPSPMSGHKFQVTLPENETAVDGDTVWNASSFYLARFSRSKLKWVDAKKLPGGGVFIEHPESMLVEKDRVWLGIRKHGPAVFNRKDATWKTYKPDLMNVTQFIMGYMRAGGKLWIATDFGVSKLDDETDKFEQVKTNIFEIQSIAPDGDTMWIGARERNTPPGPDNSGFYMFNLRTRHKVAFNEAKGVCGTHVNDIAVDPPFVWVASKQNICVYSRLTGLHKVFKTSNGLDASNFRSIAVSADKVLVGTDNGLFIKSTVPFASPETARQYRHAWNLAARGEHAQAAAAYTELAKSYSGTEADIMRYRAAHCLMLADKQESARIAYSRLLPNYPMLILDMESLFAQSGNYTQYVKSADSTCSKFGNRTQRGEICKAYLRRTDTSMRHLAAALEKNGDKDKAREYWSELLKRSDDDEIREVAKMRLVRMGRYASKVGNMR